MKSLSSVPNRNLFCKKLKRARFVAYKILGAMKRRDHECLVMLLKNKSGRHSVAEISLRRMRLMHCAPNITLDEAIDLLHPKDGMKVLLCVEEALDAKKM